MLSSNTCAVLVVLYPRLVVFYPRIGGALSENWWCYIRELVVLYPRKGGVISEDRRDMHGVKVPNPS